MSELNNFFENNTGKVIQKWNHYFEIYDRHFRRYRNERVSLLEIGVSQGGSLEMWKDFFGSKAMIYGVDVNPQCKQFEDDRTKIFIGDQEDRQFLRRLRKEIGKVDILIDDGGHTMKQQINTFEELFPMVDDRGVLLWEDICTSYWPYYGGGCGKKGTFVEFSKKLIDHTNAWFSKEPKKLPLSSFSTAIYCLHFYAGAVVVEKRPMEAPREVISGKLRLPPFDYVNPLATRVPFALRALWRKIRRRGGS